MLLYRWMNKLKSMNLNPVKIQLQTKNTTEKYNYKQKIPHKTFNFSYNMNIWFKKYRVLFGMTKITPNQEKCTTAWNKWFLNPR